MDKLGCKAPVNMILAVFVMVLLVVFVLMLFKEMNLETGTSYFFLHTVLQTKTAEF